MRFLSVADRELRAAARQKATYRARWVTAAIFFALLVWMLWLFRRMGGAQAGPIIFKTFSVVSFLYCLFRSTANTADCISSERREGTLGLLFLTNLNSAEIIAGKLCSTALSSVYSLLAIFPIIALSLMMGGITFAYFGRTVLALLTGILLALAVGFLASVVCKRQFTAIGLALLVMLLLCGGLVAAAQAAAFYPRTRFLSSWLASFSPLYTLLSADTARGFGKNYYWASAAAVTGLSLGCLGLSTLLLACTWRDRPKSVRPWQRLKWWRRAERPPSAWRTALRRRLLGINPLLWLDARQRVSAPLFMVLAIGLTVITVYMTAPYFGRTVGGGAIAPIAGQAFAWLWTGLLLHALVLYYGATVASQRLAEDKQTGALELVLSTPITERTLLRGLWLAYARKMLFPALVVLLVHLFFLWMIALLMVLDPPGRAVLNGTPSQVFWSALLGLPLKGRALDWQCGFILHIPVLFLLLMMASWPTLGWVGRWLGLRLKHPGLAPMGSLALLIIPPLVLFSVACYLAAEFNLTRLPERQFLPLMMWVAFFIGLGHCLALSSWAAARLRYSLRAVALSRYQPLPGWRWRLPRWRTVRRVAVATATAVLAVAALVSGYYGYQNWSSRRAWRSFQKALSQRGESLNVASLLPPPVADEANFARSPAFLGLLSKTNRELTAWCERQQPFTQPVGGGAATVVLLDWNHQTNAPFQPFLTPGRQPPKGSLGTNRLGEAVALLQELEPQRERLQALTAAASRLPAFQTTTNRDTSAVLHPAWEQSLALERLHLLLQVRACASLAVGRNAEAAEDVQAGLRLAQLARQLPDARSTLRVQGMLTRSLQPLWEGLSQRAWNESQLAALQQDLSDFNLLADYTNAIRRVVLAHIAIWRAIPDSTNSRVTLGALNGGYLREPVWQLQPRAWWLEHCMQLHNVGQTLLEKVDLQAGRVRNDVGWSDLNGLPLDSTCQDLLQPPMWWGPNPDSVSFAQTAVNQAIIACALERFYLAHHVYPETLDPLVPELLARIPHDAVSGRPIIFQSLGEKAFILRGVGPNGTDDRKSAAPDDWLWTYTSNTPSTKTKASGKPPVRSPKAQKSPKRQP